MNCAISTDPLSQAALVSITLHQSPFGLAPTHDALTLRLPEGRHEDQAGLCLPLVFQLVENILGYRQVHVDASCWQYRRDTPLK